MKKLFMEIHEAEDFHFNVHLDGDVILVQNSTGTDSWSQEKSVQLYLRITLRCPVRNFRQDPPVYKWPVDEDDINLKIVDLSPIMLDAVVSHIHSTFLDTDKLHRYTEEEIKEMASRTRGGW